MFCKLPGNIQLKLISCFQNIIQSSTFQECWQILWCLQEKVRNSVQTEEEDKVRSELNICLRFDVLLVAGVNSSSVGDTEAILKEVTPGTECCLLSEHVFRLPLACAASSRWRRCLTRLLRRQKKWLTLWFYSVRWGNCFIFSPIWYQMSFYSRARGWCLPSTAECLGRRAQTARAVMEWAGRKIVILFLLPNLLLFLLSGSCPWLTMTLLILGGSLLPQEKMGRKLQK